jgi:hypothetical protein
VNTLCPVVSSVLPFREITQFVERVVKPESKEPVQPVTELQLCVALVQVTEKVMAVPFSHPVTGYVVFWQAKPAARLM